MTTILPPYICKVATVFDERFIFTATLKKNRTRIQPGPSKTRKTSIVTGLVLSAFIVLTSLTGTSSQAASNFESVKFLREIRTGLSQPIDIALTDGGETLLLDKKDLLIKAYDNTGNLVRQFGGKEHMKRPVAMATGSGVIVVADESLKKVLVFDKQGALLTDFGSRGKAPGQFNKLKDIEVDPFGFIYTADAGNRSVSRFSHRGILMSQVRFKSHIPEDIALDASGNVYVLMNRSSIVYKLRLDGSSDHREALDFSPQPKNALGLFVDNKGDLYLSQGKKNNVVKYDSKGRLLTSFGSRGKGPGAFNKPTRLDGNDQGELYLIDGKNKRAQVFHLQGSNKPRLTAVTQSPPTVSLTGSEAVKEPLSDLFWHSQDLQLRLYGKSGRILSKGLQTTVIGKTGKKPGEFRKPMGLAILANKRIVVADTGNHRVQILSSDGRSTIFGERGNEPGFFKNPTDVAVNSEGVIYVADSGNTRVQLFTDQGIYLHSFGKAGKSKKGQHASLNSFNGPLFLAIDSSNRVYVLDVGNTRIATFNSRGEPQAILKLFTEPVGITIDPFDNIYIADNSCHCVKVIDTTGHQIVQFGAVGNGEGQLGDITAIAASGNQVFVADSTHRLLKTFALNLGGTRLEQRITLSHHFFVPIEATSDKSQMAKYQKLAAKNAAEKLSKIAGISKRMAQMQMRIDKKVLLPGGEIQLIVSIQKPGPLLNTSPPDKESLPPANKTDAEALELAF